MSIRESLNPSAAMRVILILGVVSLLGDIIYEGARSVSGPYLLLLGASAFTVAWVSGLGEFIGYAVRLVSGYFADRTGSYWTFAIAGYLMIGAVPFLVFAGSWEAAVVLLLVERLGKAVRSPSKDAILSHAAHGVGRGWGFGIHEAMDQVGAIAGPLFLSFVFYRTGGYRTGLLFLFLPAAALLAVLAFAKKEGGRVEEWEGGPSRPSWEAMRGLQRPYWLYGLFTFFSVAGFAPFVLIAFHLKVRAVATDAQIPLLFAGAMAVDGVAALIAGRAYDRTGLRSLLLVPAVTLAIPFLVFRQSLFLVMSGIGLWGLVMGIHESVMRAALGDLTPAGVRGSAYGVFNTLYGLGSLVSGLTVGLLYQTRPFFIPVFVLVAEAAAAACLVLLRREAPPAGWRTA